MRYYAGAHFHLEEGRDIENYDGKNKYELWVK
jgi:hypothetical protein